MERHCGNCGNEECYGLTEAEIMRERIVGCISCKPWRPIKQEEKEKDASGVGAHDTTEQWGCSPDYEVQL